MVREHHHRWFESLTLNGLPVSNSYAPVAQWIEHWASDPGVAGSTPAGRANFSRFLQLTQVFLALPRHLLRPCGTCVKNEPPALSILVMDISSWCIIKSEV